MDKQDIIDMTPGEDGIYEPISEDKKRRAERIYNNQRRREREPARGRSIKIAPVPPIRRTIPPPATFFGGFGEGLRVVAHAKREFERFLEGIMEED